jgi:hypothetical protein
MMSIVARCAMKLLAAVVFLGLGYGSALAQDAESVSLPLTFHADTGQVRTSACLQVMERQYPDNRWWERADKMTRAAEAFRAVVAAVKASDRSALQRLSDTSQAEDAAQFNRQAAAYFEQAQAFDITSVHRAFEFDGLITFYAGIQHRTGRTGFAPFVFAVQGQSVRFLPNRADVVTYQLVRDWFNSAWGPGGTSSPSYCSDADVKRATHRVSLAEASAQQPSVLFLTGAPLDAPGTLAGVAARLNAADEAMKSALVRTPDEFARHLTPPGADKLLKWWAKASEFERTAYREAILHQRPFFVFDASPLLVLYTKSQAGAIQVMYFTRDANGELRWTNASSATIADAVFKRGPLFESAKLPKPFSNISAK